MAIIKKGESYGPVPMSKIVLICKTCEHIDVILDKDYDPKEEFKCPKCKDKMVVGSIYTEDEPKNKKIETNKHE